MRYGRVHAVYLNANGYPVCDIGDEHNGATYRGCRFLVGGGGKDSGSYFPPALQSRVVYGLVSDMSAVVFGVVTAPDGIERLTDTPEEVGYDEEFPNQVGPKDAFVTRSGTWVFLTEDGQLVFDAATSMQPIRLQMAGNACGHLRIAQDGAAEERVLLAGPTREYLDKLHDDIVELRKVVSTLAAALATAGVGGAAASSVGTTYVPAWEKDVTLGATADSMVASAVRISARSVTEDGV